MKALRAINFNFKRYRIGKLSLTQNKIILRKQLEKDSILENKALGKQIIQSRSCREKFQTYTGEKLNWFQVILRLKRSVIRGILPGIAICSLYALLITLLDRQFTDLLNLEQIQSLPKLIVTLNIVLSLLLAFRTNTAHQRFWEGRKLWGAMVNVVRNLSRSIWIIIEECEPKDRYQKEVAIGLVTSFPIAMKLHLRREPVNHELEPFMLPWQYNKLLYADHPPLEVAFWIGDYLQNQYEKERLNVFQLTALQEMLNEMVDILGGCERILKTPVPIVYTITLKILFVVYFLILPLGLVQNLGILTVPIVAFISFLILSINEIGSEIEEPFGRDPNDLPLDFICNTIVNNVKELLLLESSHRFSFDKMRSAKRYLFSDRSVLSRLFQSKLFNIKE